LLIKEFLIFSVWARFAYLFVLCALVGFLVPGLTYDPKGTPQEIYVVEGTCHVEIGARTDCMPDYSRSR